MTTDATELTALRERLRQTQTELAEAKRAVPAGLASMELPAAIRRLAEDCAFAEQKALDALARLERLKPVPVHPISVPEPT